MISIRQSFVDKILKDKNANILIIGTLAYLFLAVVVGIYYKERTALLDISFRLFHIIKDGNLSLQTPE